ncbi:hypothetical protein AMJ44_12250 [candidate division WOR-1 bacterium DG_54_3]|uniref:Uncharacterized protein n=1 Tax=candidate division WOR-1 bacterium DG_54_3 TaxID=1703775 RepID=A0A0S7XQE4_UNCSA|nr:MAG: hypothetical protein AMJ44_12250 [candidate division WOR-1 bacterium DG_54_3]
MQDIKPTREALIRKGETRRWQPPSYKYYDMQGKELTFTIRLMRDEERRYWSGTVVVLLSEARDKDTPDRRKREIFQQMSDELYANFVEKIENVPGWVVDKGEEERLTITEPIEILEVIKCLPGKDGEALDNAIWDINTLKEGEVKNSKRSPNSAAGEPNTNATPVVD